jgi:FkbM family methyltransferase
LKQALKNLVIGFAVTPTLILQRLLRLVGVKRFVQGDVFDRLLETRTIVLVAPNKHLTFHTPNGLTKFRADTLMEKEPETLAWINGFASDSVFWDIGANVGTYSLYAALIHPKLKIYSIEPSIENTYLLNRNLSENRMQERILAIPFALSEETGVNLFQHQHLQLGGAISSFGVEYSYDGKKAQFTEMYRVLGFKADDLGPTFGIPQPNHVKIDVDGIEHLIARGARNILSHPDLKSVLVELNFDFSLQRDEVIKIFDECGLELKEFKHADAFYGDGGFSKIYNHIFTRR